MGLEYILRRCAQKAGFTTTGDDRTFLLDYINEAAEELYEAADYPGCLRECVLQVNSARQLALPSFIGQLRAMREYYSTIPWTIQDMRPRYHNNSWPADSWKMWRYKGEQALQMDISNTAPFTVTLPVGPAVVISLTLSGQTINSKRDTETIQIQIASTLGAFTKQFTKVDSFRKDLDSKYDITLSDADDNILAVLDNDALESRYVIIDVSNYPFSSTFTPADGCTLMEVLYKLPLKPLYNNTDEFPIPGFDNVVINKVMQLIAEDSKDDDGGIRAISYDKKAQRTAMRKTQNKEKGIEQRVEFSPHRHDMIFRRRFSSYERREF